MHHHLHIGAGILLLVLLFIIAIIGSLLLAAASKRRAQLEARRTELAIQYWRDQIAAEGRRGSIPAVGRTFGGCSSTGPVAGSSPIQGGQSTVYVDRGGSSDMVTGMLLGEMATGGFGGGRETIVENNYVEPPAAREAPTSDSSSGFWDASFDSGGSSSSDSGSGIDLSWD